METLLSLVRDHGTPKLFRAGSSLFFQGEVPRDVYIIQDGIVRGYSISSTGDERITALYGKADIVPLAWVLGGTTASFTYYQAASDTRILAVPKTRFDAIVASQPLASQKLIEATGREYAGSMLRIISLTQSRTLDKLAYTFYYLAYRFGLERENGETVINIKLSQIMLASMIGQTREGTARNIKELVKMEIISYTGSTYTVYTTRLLALLGEESFRDLRR